MVKNVITKGVNTFHACLGHDEYHIHEGTVFTVLKHKRLGVDGTLDLHITCPSYTNIHFQYAISSSLEAQMQVFKDSVVTGGTVYAPRNRNEVSSNVSGIVVVQDGVLSDPGEEIANVTWGTSTQAPVGPNLGGESGSAEFIWPADAVRRFRITSKTADNNIIVRFNFTEELHI